jgi:tetratricopeptide (TPR) repeat protein
MMKNILQFSRIRLSLTLTAAGAMMLMSAPLPLRAQAEPRPAFQPILERTAANAPPQTELALRDGVAYNKDAPPLVPEPEMLRSLKRHAPQWVQQSLVWPSDLERRIHAGISTYDQRAAMIAWLDAAFQYRPLPSQLILNAIEMRNWLIMFSDWARDSGADAFVMRFTSAGFTNHITETNTNIILLTRPERPGLRGNMEAVDYAMSVAAQFVRPYLMPANREDVVAEELPLMKGAFEGTWQPGRQGRAHRPLAENPPPLAIRFFVAGDMVAINFNKNLWALVDNPMLYARRFEAPQDQTAELEILTAIQRETITSGRLNDPSERIIFYERLRQQLNIKTVEEFLGPMLYDSLGNRLTSNNLDYTRLLAAMERLNQEQREELLRQRRVDWHYLEGLRSFERGDLDMAIDHWSRALAEDPVNVRIALLLDVAAEIKIERDFGGDRQVANRDIVIDSINELQFYHRQAIRDNAAGTRNRERIRAEVLEMRNNAIELYRQGRFAESVAIWQQILEREPDNAFAALWLATLQGRTGAMPAPQTQPGAQLRQATEEARARRTPSP